MEGSKMNCERTLTMGGFRSAVSKVAARREKPGRVWMARLAFVVAMLILPTFANAQRLDGTLRVTVSDATGAGILDAKVTVTNEGTRVSVTATASSAGTYVFPNLLVGSYTVTVEKAGFKKAVNKGVQVESNQVAEVAATLEVGDATAVVEVTAGAELVKTESSELGATFGDQAVHDLPLNTLGGDVKEFSVFAPGTTTQQGGVLDNKVNTNGPTQPVIQESVAEFTLLTNQFGAEYGHSAGGQFNIVTKSGTNDWHGAAWWYNRNRDFDAATNQEKTAFTGTGDVKNRFDYNREGGSIGGPIKRNRLFIYGAYEFQGEGLGSQGATVTMPTAAGLQQLNALNPDPAVLAILKEFPSAPAKTGTTLVDGTPIDIGQYAGVAPNF